MFRSLLVPLDGSRFGEQALPLAFAIARHAGASVELFHVHAPKADAHPEFAPFLKDEGVRGQLKSRRQVYLEGLMERAKTVSAVPLRCALREGPIADTIRAQVAAKGIDLVVMTTHGRGALGRFLLGSVADALVRDLPVPLLLVHPTEAGPDLSQETRLQRILVPLDGSAIAEEMLQPAVSLARVMAASVLLLRVVRPIVLGDASLEGAAAGQVPQRLFEELQAYETEVLHSARQYLDTIAAKLRDRELQVETAVLLDDAPAVAIVDEAGRRQIDLLALATHGRRGLARFFLGSVADKVIRTAPQPVLVYRPGQK